MEASFWHERWQRQEIGFHQSQTHRALELHWASLGIQAGQRVFVPLAGKSLDMLWLAARGLEVVGIELSPLAVETFKVEHKGSPHIDLRCGDIFDLTPESLGPIDAIFDRAALVALPPEMRKRYVQQLDRLSTRGTRSLLVTMEYDQSEMPGPPHAVNPSEVQQLFGETHDILQLDYVNLLPESPKMAARGVSRLGERVYALKRR
jgi:thiopurine S-methyltransferase